MTEKVRPEPALLDTTDRAQLTRREVLAGMGIAVAAAPLTFAGLPTAHADPTDAPRRGPSPFPSRPTAETTTAEDRDQMLWQLGIELPTLRPLLEDPNRPPNVEINPADRLHWDACHHPVRRGRFGLWASYDDEVRHGAIGYGTGDNPEVDGWAYTPIDLLTRENGRRVRTPEDWWHKRRPEIFRLVQEELYGKIPDRRHWPDIRWELGETATGTADGVAYVERTVTGVIDISGYPEVRNVPRITGVLRIPAAAYEARSAVPVVIVFGAQRSWAHLGPAGWGVFGFLNRELQPDNGGANLSSYLIGLINKGRWRRPDDWGALAAWSWGISRLVDFFAEPTGYVGVDADRIGVQGHSRYGKATIVAAAYDPRIKAAYTSSSGSLGARMNRRHWGQDLENDGDYANNESESLEYHWMAGNYFRWMGPLRDDPAYPGVGIVKNGTHGTYKPRRLELMRVDGHSVVALAAPRVVFITGGNDNDAWADPRGMYLAGAHASRVYDLVGVEGLVIPPGTEFTSGACEPIGGTPPFDEAFIDGYVGFRRQDAGHVDTPGWPSFVAMSKKILDVAAFPDATEVRPGRRVTSRTWRVEGLSGPTRIRVVNGEYRIRGRWTSRPGTVRNGDEIRVRHVSADQPEAPVATVLEVGEDTYSFTSITAPRHSGHS